MEILFSCHTDMSQAPDVSRPPTLLFTVSLTSYHFSLPTTKWNPAGGTEDGTRRGDSVGAMKESFLCIFWLLKTPRLRFCLCGICARVCTDECLLLLSILFFETGSLSEPEVGCFSETGQNGPRSAHLSLPMPGLQTRTVLRGFYVSARDLNAALLLSVSS